MTKTQALNKVNEATKTFDTLSGPQKGLLNAIIAQFEVDSKAKIITEDGVTKVWCNYHNEYEPAEEFDTRINKKGVEVYKSSCVTGTSDNNKLRRLNNTIPKLLTSNLLAGMINNETFTELLREFDTLTTLEELKTFNNEMLANYITVKQI